MSTDLEFYKAKYAALHRTGDITISTSETYAKDSRSLARHVNVLTGRDYHEHRKQPKGHGSWAFAIGGNNVWVTPSTTYAAARHAACLFAADNRIDTIYTLP